MTADLSHSRPAAKGRKLPLVNGSVSIKMDIAARRNHSDLGFMVNGKRIMGLGWMLLALSTSSEASSMRCGTSIVVEGDTMQQVLDKCGPPDSKEVWQPKLRVNGVPEKGAAKLEFWIYGPSGGVYRKLRFIDDRLVQVEMERK